LAVLVELRGGLDAFREGMYSSSSESSSRGVGALARSTLAVCRVEFRAGTRLDPFEGLLELAVDADGCGGLSRCCASGVDAEGDGV
jgi:hypothetical protein